MTYKTLIIIVAIFLLAGLGVGFFIFREGPTREVVETTAEEAGGFFPGAPDSSTSSRSGAGQGFKLRDSGEGGESGGSSSLDDSRSPAARLRQFISVPVTSATILERGSGGDGHVEIVVRYLERDSGHVEEMALNEKLPTKVSNTTLPKSISALWGPNGESLLIRFLDGPENRLETVFARIISPKQATSTETRRLTFGDVTPLSVGTIEGSLLPQSIKEIAVSPAHNKVFFLLTAEGGKGGVTGVVSDFARADSAHGQVPVYSSSFRDWLPQWVNGSTVALVTKPSSGVPGYLYLLNTANKQQEKLLDAITGLTALVSPKGRLALYAQAQGTGFGTYLFDITRRKGNAFPLQTMPEKCVFRTDESSLFCAVPETILPGVYPDEWYQGLTRWRDSFWEVDLETGEARRLTGTASTRQGDDFDAIDLQISADGKVLLFKNKIDSTLWVLEM